VPVDGAGQPPEAPHSTHDCRGLCLSLFAPFSCLGGIVPGSQTAADQPGRGYRQAPRGQVMTAGSEARSWLRDHKTTMKRVATGVFVCIVIALLVRVGMTIEWDEVVDAILDTSPAVLWTAVPLVIASYCVYACYDILGKRYTGHDLPWWQCMKVAFISYAFTMNFSAAVGGLAMRLRLYGKYGLAPGEIMRIMGLSITTNWIGYCMLAGLIFASGAIKPPGEWGIGGGWLRVVGGLLVVVALAYLALSAFSKRRSWKIRDHTIELPDLRTAVLQVALSMVNWSI